MKSDRRVKRTRKRLQKALIDLIGERDFDAITVQDIVDRADVGRTTFYLHYDSKDDLFMSCHQAIVSQFHFGPHYAHSREAMLASQAPPEMARAYRHLKEAWSALYPILQGKDGPLILRRIRDRSAEEIEDSLRAAFAEDNSAISYDVLANYLSGAQLALVYWWLEKRRPHTAEEIAEALHRLQRAAIRDAFGL